MKLFFQNNTFLLYLKLFSFKCNTFYHVHEALFFKNSTLLEESVIFHTNVHYKRKKSTI